MSTAVLISGQLRTFAKCWPTQRWHVLRHFADPHFFFCVQHQEDAHQILGPVVAELGADRVHTSFRTDPDLSDYLTPELSAAYHQAPYANAAPAHQLLLQHWYQQQCWEFFQSLCASAPLSETRFETVVRLRVDLWFHSFEEPSDKDYQFICPPKGARIFGKWGDVCYTPAWGEFGGINDRFAVMGLEAARYYFTVFKRLPELLAAGCPFHPESLVAASLELGNISLHRTLKTFFSTERLDGTRRWPEITPMDMLNASLTRAA
jgi:hypothetical protein